MNALTINERIQSIVDQIYNGNTRKFCLVNHLPIGTIQSIVGKRQSKPSQDTLDLICVELSKQGVNASWIRSGEGSMLIATANISDEKPDEPTVEKTIPYFPDVNASAGMDFLTENGHNYNVPIKIPNIDAQAFINVFGDSMYPKYCSGEIIGIKEIEKDMVFPGHAYVVQMTDGEAYIKYIDPGNDEEHWILRSENEKYKPKQFHLSKIRKVYIIKAVITKSTLL